MKNDYLWDKSGSDAAIEELEQTLAVCAFEKREFRVNVGANLAPATRGPEVLSWWRRFVSPAWALSAVGLVIAFGAGFMMLAGSDAPVNQTVPAVSGGDIVVSRELLRDEPRREASVPDDRTIVYEAAPRPRTAMVRLNPKPVQRSRAGRRKNADAAITAEEKRAYDQLMFALTLTGSKLKLVNDAVNGPDVRSAFR